MNAKDFLKLSYEDKLMLTKTKIKMFYNRNKGNICVAFSGGKDSTVLAHIVNKEMKLNIPLVFSNTGNEHKYNYFFLKELKETKELGEIIIIRPKIGFKKSVEKFGYPLVGKEYADSFQKLFVSSHLKRNSWRSGFYSLVFRTKSGFVLKYSPKWFWIYDIKMLRDVQEMLYKIDDDRKHIAFLREIFTDDLIEYTLSIRKELGLSPYTKIRVSNRCCDNLKKQPFSSFVKKTGIGRVVGTRADESRLRRVSLEKRGCYDEGRNLLQPLLWWTEEDINNYIKLNNVKISKAYEYEKRTGCVSCGFGLYSDKNRFDRVRDISPVRFKQYYKWKNIHSDISFGEALEFYERFVKEF